MKSGKLIRKWKSGLEVRMPVDVSGNGYVLTFDYDGCEDEDPALLGRSPKDLVENHVLMPNGKKLQLCKNGCMTIEGKCPECNGDQETRWTFD